MLMGSVSFLNHILWTVLSPKDTPVSVVKGGHYEAQYPNAKSDFLKHRDRA